MPTLILQQLLNGRSGGIVEVDLSYRGDCFVSYCSPGESGGEERKQEERREDVHARVVREVVLREEREEGGRLSRKGGVGAGRCTRSRTG